MVMEPVPASTSMAPPPVTTLALTTIFTGAGASLTSTRIVAEPDLGPPEPVLPPSLTRIVISSLKYPAPGTGLKTNPATVFCTSERAP